MWLGPVLVSDLDNGLYVMEERETRDISALNKGF